MIKIQTPYVLDGCCFSICFRKHAKKKLLVFYNRNFFFTSTIDELVLVAKKNKRIYVFWMERVFIKVHKKEVQVNTVNVINTDDQNFVAPKIEPKTHLVFPSFILKKIEGFQVKILSFNKKKNINSYRLNREKITLNKNRLSVSPIQSFSNELNGLIENKK
jgi:hypothetical protein